MVHNPPRLSRAEIRVESSAASVLRNWKWETVLQVDPMEYTDERMIPEYSDTQTFWDHIHRYRFASKWVKGKRVLDIASGEGYGTFGLLSAGAKSVIGVDIDEEACAHAARKYGIDARVGSAEDIPLESG